MKPKGGPRAFSGASRSASIFQHAGVSTGLKYLPWLLLGVFCAALLPGQDTRYLLRPEQIPGPANAAEFEAWRADIEHWRHERRIRIGYEGAEYSRPEFQWTQGSFVQTLMLVEERYFYDPTAGKYTVDRYLDDLERRYGGIDSVLIWLPYPNFGIDDRNQYDHLRDMPGGIPALKQMVADFHRRGVRVLFPVLMEDQGTRDEGVPNWEASARLMAEISADGLFGDTADGIPKTFLTGSDRLGKPLVLEPELAMPDVGVAWNLMSWGYWSYSFVPAVSRYKWLESRHMVHLCRRWVRDRNDDLQHAFFNGVGYESWENIWGIWNQIVPRDGEALRRIARIERTFADFLASADWEPHTSTLQFGVFVTKFPGAGRTLWTFVNRNEYSVVGRQIRVRHEPGRRYYDLWHGLELEPEVTGDAATLSFDMEARGFGAVFSAEQNRLPEGLSRFLLEMRELARTPLGSFSREWKFLPQQLVKIDPTKMQKVAPPGMVRIPAADFEFRVSGIEIEAGEGGNDIGVDVQYPWEDSPRLHHLKRLHVPAFYIDRYPVTNAEFKRFLDTIHYHPKDDHNFLRDWKGGTFPAGWENKPVTWVSLEDARAYAAWAGKRLPREWEWLYAAQGTGQRLYPWGNQWEPTAVPTPEKRRQMREPTNVDAYPKGASPFGVMDMVGNVWQWTDEYVDEHTRAAILRGGCYYQPQGTMWYFPQAYRLDQHGKYLLMAPSHDRSGTVGFRCVMDAE